MTRREIHVTDAARRAIEAVTETTTEAAILRIGIGPRFDYELRFDTPTEGDVVVESNGVRVCLDSESATRADGMTIDFTPSPDGGGFTIENPNVPAEIRQLSPEELEALLEDGPAFELIDVRTPAERAVAVIEGSRLLDQALHDELMTLDRGTMLVFQCHHGMRSQSAAEYFRAAGFRRVCNLRGGIDAWSQQVDSSVPRY